MTQKEEEDEHHQYDALDQGIPNGVDGRVYQLNAIVERRQCGTARQNLVVMNIFDLGLDRIDDFTGVASADHEHRAGHDLTLPIEHHRAMANRMADTDFSDIAHEDRRAAGLLDDD